MLLEFTSTPVLLNYDDLMSQLGLKSQAPSIKQNIHLPTDKSVI